MSEKLPLGMVTAFHAARDPNRPMATFGDETLTRGQMEARANRRARMLAAQGVGHGDFVTAIWWPDGKSILSVPRTGPAHRWNAENAKKTGELSGWEAEPTRLLVDGTNVFTASFDRQVRRHATPTNRVIRVFTGHTDAVYSLAHHRQSGRLASGSHDGEVRIWQVEDGELLLRFVAAPGYTPKLSRTP